MILLILSHVVAASLLKMLLQELEHDLVFFAPHLIPGPCWSISVRCLKRSFALPALGTFVISCKFDPTFWTFDVLVLLTCAIAQAKLLVANCAIAGSMVEIILEHAPRTCERSQIANTSRKWNKKNTICYQAGTGTRKHATLASLQSFAKFGPKVKHELWLKLHESTTSCSLQKGQEVRRVGCEGQT